MNQDILLELTVLSTLQVGFVLIEIIFLHQRLRLSDWFTTLLNFLLVTAVSAVAFSMFSGHLPGFQSILLSLIFLLIVVLAEPEWKGLGHALLATVSLSAFSYLAALGHAFTLHLGGSILSILLILVIIFFTFTGLIHFVGSSFELADVLFRKEWDRMIEPVTVSDYKPFVSIHVPAHAEPPDMVIETLKKLKALDYPNYEVILIDDNTPDELIWMPVREAALGLGFKFKHVMDRPGFKAGALNEALAMTDPGAELVAVIDSDYQVSPDFLSSVTPYFKDPGLAFIQTPQDYRDFDPKDPFEGGMYLGYEFFFQTSMKSRNERNGIIFAGTMGIIRKKALLEIGGWNENSVTEDAELSLRLLSNGYRSYFLDRTFGHGLMPTNLDSYKKQIFRWCIGGVQILKKNIWNLMPFSRSKLDIRQKFEYLYGFWGWTGSVVTLFFAILAILGAVAHLLEIKALLYFIGPEMLLIAISYLLIYQTRFIWSFRQLMGCTTIQALTGYIAVNSLTLPIAKACLKGLITDKAFFNRTPKEAVTGPSFIRQARTEFLIALAAVSLSIALLIAKPLNYYSALLVFLLLWNGLFLFGPTVLFSYWGFRSEERKAKGI
jgi:cellulose synthase/poly-beta-1,6-N-acetylglucosamine synthase-like glycosyltransferase